MSEITLHIANTVDQRAWDHVKEGAAGHQTSRGDPVQQMTAPQCTIPRSSPNDKRGYRAITLENGLQVLLISDEQVAAGPPATADGGEVAATAGSHAHPGEEEVCSDDDDADSLLSGDEDMSEGSSEEGSEESDEEHEHVHQHSGQHKHHSAPEGATKKAGAALSCGVGSFSDPWRAQGLSHFLEHMLFMGSESFPDENEYDSFLSTRGGASNACTEEECTTFHFDVKPDALRGALERFSGFFVSPLIKRGAMEREVLAVDNEFSGVLQSDSCRLMQLRCHTSRQGHLCRKFAWGNRKSLMEDPGVAGIDMREELLTHYRGEYSAERMNLVILGGEPLDTLQQWATELFSAVPSGRGPRPSYAAEGFPLLGGRLYILPAVREEHRLEATFQLPCMTGQYRKKAEDYISHLVGHEGRGSLLSALKARGWATELSAGVAETTSLASLFNISITLTEAGLTDGPGCGLACVQLLFEYLALLREGPQRWVWDEMAAMGEMRFRFQEEEETAEYVASIASDLHHYPPEDVLIQPNLYAEFDPDLISQLLSVMTPHAVRLDLQTHHYEACKQAALAGMPGAGCSSEPWFGFEYAEAPVPQELLAAWAVAQPSVELALPLRNDYLPTNFTLRCGDAAGGGTAGPLQAAAGASNAAAATDVAAAQRSAESASGMVPEAAVAADGVEDGTFPSPPALLLDSPGLRLFHKLDTTFRVPRTNAYFKLVSPSTYDSPRSAALTHLVVKLLEDALCETAYAADVAGLHYGIWFEGRAGLDFKVDGFSHKLPLLVEFIFRSLAGLGCALQPDSFARVKEALVRTYRNSNMKPLKHATFLRLYALKDLLWHPDVVLPELEAASLAEVQAFLPSLLSILHIEALLHGNITAEEARRLAWQVHEVLGGSTLGADQRLVDRTVQLPKGTAFVHRAPVKNPEEENSCVEAYLQACTDTVADRAVIDLLDQILYEPCFDTLRTREQLGYTVSSGMRLTHGVLGFAVLVMSGEHGPAHLDARMDAFLEAFAQQLASMSSEEFEKHRASLISAKLQRDPTMAHESDRAWDAIATRRYDFNTRRDEVAHLRAIELAQVQQFYERHLRPNSPARRKLSIHVVGRAHLEEMAAGAASGHQEVGCLDDFKAQSCCLYPARISMLPVLDG